MWALVESAFDGFAPLRAVRRSVHLLKFGYEQGDFSDDFPRSIALFLFLFCHWSHDPNLALSKINEDTSGWGLARGGLITFIDPDRSRGAFLSQRHVRDLDARYFDHAKLTCPFNTTMAGKNPLNPCRTLFSDQVP